MSKTRISILIADDHSVIREGLKILLGNEKDFSVIGEASTGKEAVDLAKQHSPDIVIMDLSMPILNGFEAMRQIRRARPATRLVVLSAYCDDEYVERSSEIGAHGFISKEHTFSTLANAIRQITRGKCPFLSLAHVDGAAQKSRKGAPKSLSDKGRNDGLTVRELQVLQLVSEGAANKQVAATLGISIKTVQKHRQQLMDKLDIHDTAGLTRYAIAAGVIDNSATRKRSPA